MSTRVGTKGQVVIEKSIRDRLGIEPGCLAYQEVAGDRVVIRFVPAEHERSLRGDLAGSRRRSVDPGVWPEAVADAWTLSVAEGRVDGYGE